ncbi:unnamed protein product, partial [Candidula unifasciata]
NQFFTPREKDRQAKLIIKMQGNMTSISNPENPSNQLKVFQDLGQGVLRNAFEGYNCSLFAYGQTGSGKSYSMVGYGPNNVFLSTQRFQVTFSMLEIYNEQVRDLLSKDSLKGGTSCAAESQTGHVLQHVHINSCESAQLCLHSGTSNRTVASTNMNATSSRAHTVVTIVFDQIIKNSDGDETKISSTMNLVDLAGSERADSTGATGDRLKEGANINRSLSALGNVISVVVPYRDSVLTKLLQNALGGNSKTVMIAALSPADINYDETLSTLRYADRAKKIKNKAVINENPLDKMLRELKILIFYTEMEAMRKDMEEKIRAQLMANQQLIGDSEKSWDEKVSRSKTNNLYAFAKEEHQEVVRKNKEPHLINLNEDPMLSGTVIGNKNGNPDIVLNGLSIQKNHAVLTVENGDIVIKPGSDGAKIRVNGIAITGSRTLEHMDRKADKITFSSLLSGSNHVYYFVNPLKPKAPEDTPKEITWEYAQKEVAEAKGFAIGLAGLTKEQQIVQEQILEVLPMVSEVNAVSEELNKHKSFEVVLVPSAIQVNNSGKSDSGAQVMVKMKDLLNGNTWLWEHGKFMNRRYLIQEMYQRYIDGENMSSIPKEKDPFWEPAEDVLIGTANVFLQSLLYALDFADELSVTDYKGLEEGKLMISINPCDQSGLTLHDDNFVEDPKDLLDKPFHFKISIRSAEIYKTRYSKGIKVKYRLLNDKDFTETKMLTGTLTPEFCHY